MEKTQDNKAFSKEIPLLQTAWDSTSLGLAKTCWRKYYYQIICGWQSRGENIHLSFGIHYHKALETYDKVKFETGSHDEGQLAAIKYCMTLGERQEDGTFKHWDTDTSHKDYGLKNRYTLTRAVCWYLEKFKDDPCKTLVLENGRPAVELSFRMGIGSTAADGSEYLLCGHIDRAVTFGDHDFVLDRKTSKTTLSDYYFQQFNPSNQMTLYTTAGQVILKRAVKGAIMDACQLAVGFARFARHITYRTEAQLNEWLKNSLTYFRQAEKNAQDNYWPMNDTACDKFGGCPFREICGADPSVRELYLKSKFEQRIWDPLETRE